jgi:short-subunit dehydrogenase
MSARDQGHVVNTASALGLATIPGLVPYCASEHAVVALSEALHRGLNTRG